MTAVDALAKRLFEHVSSMTLSAGILFLYVLNDNPWLISHLPENGKPLILFIIVAVVYVYETSVKNNRKVVKMLLEMARTSEIKAVKSDINGLYRHYKTFGERYITDEATIMEIDATHDSLKSLKINSYHQRKIEFLSKQIKREVDNAF